MLLLQDNTLVMLDPLVAEGTGQILDTVTAAGVTPGVGVNAPAKIDPSLPGVSHPAQRGTPGLDTIDETGVPQGAQGGAPPLPVPTTSGSQSQNPAPPAAVAGQSDAGNPAPGETDSTGDAPAARPSYAAALMSDSVGSEVGENGNEASSGAEAGSTEQAGEVKSAEQPATQPEAGPNVEGGEVPVAEAEEAQYGAHKIPGNPPFVSDDDEDEQEHDMSHPEGFLRAMPEDESAMRVLKLPDGRVRRVEDDDDEEGGVHDASPADDADTDDTPVQTAPSSAQAPPLSSGPSPPAASEVTVPATAEGPGPAAAAPSVQAPRPPVTDSAVFHSGGGNKGSMTATTETSSVATTVSSTPGTISPSGIVVSSMGIQGTMFPAIGGGTEPGAAAPVSALASDPGFVGPSVGPAVSLQRARSFSPVEHVPEPLHHVALPPMAPAPTCPAPTFPAPHPPGQGVDFVEHNVKPHSVQPPDVLGTGNGPGGAVPAGYEGERPPLSAQQADQELQGLLSGRAAGSGKFQTEIKIANLQGPEQEVMRLVMHTYIEGRLQEVEFDFNLSHDHPEQVCCSCT